MITLSIKINVRPNTIREFEQTVSLLEEELRKLKKCESFRIYRETQNSQAYLLIYRYRESTLFEKHLKSKHHKILMGAIYNLCEPPTAIVEVATIQETKQI